MDQYFELTCTYKILISHFEDLEPLATREIIEGHQREIEDEIAASDMVPQLEDCFPQWDYKMMPYGWRPREVS